MKRCRFLEVSVTSENILASLEFYRALGFEELPTGDAWEHPYAVVSDGRMVIGLHAREIESPTLSFVLPDLAATISSQLAPDLTMRYARTGDEHFHEAGFRDPGGQALMLLEARTFSPPDFAESDTSLLGYFEGYASHCRNIDASVACWEELGFIAMDDASARSRSVTLMSEGLNILLHEDPGLREPRLVYSSDELQARIALLRHRNFELELETAQEALLRSPEGLLISLISSSEQDSSGEFAQEPGN